MSVPELATIANHALPIKIIVVNNGYLGMVRQWQELFYNNRLSSVELDTFPGCREARRRLRLQGPDHRSSEPACSALEEAVKEPGPYLLNMQRHAV